eukprot:6487229-Amphidinium_carterae.3
MRAQASDKQQSLLTWVTRGRRHRDNKLGIACFGLLPILFMLLELFRQGRNVLYGSCLSSCKISLKVGSKSSSLASSSSFCDLLASSLYSESKRLPIQKTVALA